MRPRAPSSTPDRPSTTTLAWPTRVRRALGLLLLGTVALAGCRKTGGDPHPPGPRRDRDPTVFHRSLSEPENLDPGLAGESEGGKVINDTFEGLYVYGRDHTAFVPGVATHHTVSPDGLDYVFHLRADARWSDGTPVVAGDFEFAWRRVLEPKTGARYASILWPIQGARACNAGEAPCADVAVHAVDDHTLTVRLESPLPIFADLTAFYTYAPVPRHALAKFGDRWARPENLVSNGPWVVRQWQSQQRIVAEANPHYHSPADRPFTRIEYHITQENEPAHAMYLAGDLDFIDGAVPATVLSRYRLEHHPHLVSGPYLGVYFYQFNVRRKPFDDKRVRQALALSIHRDALGPYVIKGGQPPARALVPPGLKALGYQGPEGMAEDSTRARALLAEAGYPEGKGLRRIAITYNTLDTHRLIAEFVQQAWRTNLGIDTELENLEWKVLLSRQQTGDFDVTRWAWIGDYLDPLTFLELFEGGNPNNNSGWQSAAYDDLLRRARRAPTRQERLDLLAQAEVIFLDELPAVPLYFYVKQDLVQPWLKGHGAHLQGIHLSRWFSIDPARMDGSFAPAAAPASGGAP